MNLLTQEFRTVNTYNTVIKVCAGGANKVTEIAGKAHITTAYNQERCFFLPV